MKALGTFAEAVVAQERQAPLGRRLVVHSDGHPVRTTLQASRRPLMDRS